MLGGAMRQVGIFAAAALYALEHNVERLAEDHANARTNILVFGLAADAPDAPTVVARAQERGVLVFAFGPRKIRAVTHLDVPREQCERAAEILVEIAEGRPA